MSIADPKWPRCASTAELRNIVTALSLHSWNNTAAEIVRLDAARDELTRRGGKHLRIR